MKITIVGSGNVASWLAFTLNKSCVCVKQVYGRSLSSATRVASLCGAEVVDRLSDLDTDSDYYLFSLKDDAYAEVLSSIPFQMSCAVHTAGSLPQSVFDGHARHYGVLYPFQTISETADFDSLKVPLCIEGENEDSYQLILKLADFISPFVSRINGEQRAALHLAAVFASNFSNALYDVAFQLLSDAGIEWKVMQPLLQQTLDKTMQMTPRHAQTGPAARNDQTIMARHLAQLPSAEWQQIYQMMSDYIIKQRR